MSLLPFPQAVARPASAPATATVPRAPQTWEDTGLPHGFLVELIAKAMFQLGIGRLHEISTHLCLSGVVVDTLTQFMRRESLVEVARRGQHEADIQFDLTQVGRARALDWLSRNQYVGPAPVPLESYVERVQAQSVTLQAITAAQVRQSFADLVVPERLMDLLGTAVNSGRPMLLHGPAGTGKTYLASHLRRLLPGDIAVPHAICVHGEVIRIYDPHCHQLAEEAAAPRAALDNRVLPDPRWVQCRRPVVVSGGELTLEMLDLSFDARAGYYEAPPHFKANNGLFIVDDLGRQVITPRQLMNRWIVPMEKRHDHLMLRNGGKFTIPFDMVLVFSSNLTPAELEDAAFLRRLGHKIAIEAVSVDDYRLIFRRACDEEGIEADDAAFERLVEGYHVPLDRPLYACYPRDLLHLIASRSRYLGVPARLTPALLDWAWNAYFANDADLSFLTSNRSLS